MRRGHVTPLLGAGVNLSARPENYQWRPPARDERGYLPSGAELASYIADSFEYPAAADLMQISQAAEIDHGTIPLIQSLSRLFHHEYPVSNTHRFLARIPNLFQNEPPAVRYQLIMSTNYDNLMELAFRDEQQDYDLIWYQADGTDRGSFFHEAPGTPPVQMTPNYSYPFFQSRPVILKLHGTVLDAMQGSYVITEDHYIHYTARIDHRALPKTLTSRWINFLYLGYSLRDFNLRVIVRRLQESDGMARVSWAVLPNPTDREIAYWQTNSVTLVSMDLMEYLKRLESCLRGQGAAE
jgi:hypothetical protein